MLRRFISYYRYYKGLFALDMSVAVLSSVLSVIAPALVRDVLYTALPAGNWELMIWMLSVILVIYIAQAVATYIRIRWGHYLGVRMENQMRKELFSHLQTLSFSYFDKTKTGTIMSRITNDLFNIAEVAHHGPEDFLISIVTIIAAYSFMFSFSWKLSLVSLIPLPIMLVYGIHFGIREVKSYSQEKFQEKKFGVSNTKLKESRESMYSTMANYQTGMSFMRDFYYFTTIAGGVLLIAAGQAAVYDLVTFVLYVSVVLPPIDRLINFTEQFTQGMASFERFAEILDINPQIEDKPGAKALSVSDGTVDFSHVSFSYEADDRGAGKTVQGLPLLLPGRERAGCADRGQILQPIGSRHMAHHRRRKAGGRRLAALRILPYPGLGMGLRLTERTDEIPRPVHRARNRDRPPCRQMREGRGQGGLNHEKQDRSRRDGGKIRNRRRR